MSHLSCLSFSSFPSLFLTAMVSPHQKMPQGFSSHPLSSAGVLWGTPLPPGLVAAVVRAPGESLLLVCRTGRFWRSAARCPSGVSHQSS